ncbi:MULTISPECIES: IclR family transcriptional regulator [Alphaproteobacteria]|uniref:IclR family transcriptional regulator n=1 Tax=Alphaproteobacteria TaxID=28211 RepID=UPI0011A84FB6|nr:MULTISPECIES: IclR family transcriptional regulator C-terminal domain-containing protein [Alphaproteobacteria]QRI93550.1 hypothetical protein [Rhizobium sp.]
MKTLHKVGSLLRQFTAEQPEHSVTDLARAINNSVSGTHDLVNGLGRIGLLRKVERGRYRLGPLVATLHRAFEDSSPLMGAARPVLAELLRGYGETVYLTMEDHGRLLILEALEGTQALRVSREMLGTGVTLHDSPPGLLHLAQYSHQQIDEYLDHYAQPENALHNRESFRNRLADIASEGFLAGPPANEPDVICVSAMIQNHISQPVAALVLVVPRSRHEIQPRAFRNIVVEAARRVSLRLQRHHDPN